MKGLLNAQHPVLLFANGYGDHYLNLPAIRALAQIFKGRLTLVGIQGAIEQVTEGLSLKKVIGLPMGYHATGRLFNAQAAAEKIAQCDLFISLNPWLNDNLLALMTLLAPEVSVGFFEDYDINVPRDYRKHSADLAFDIVRVFEPEYLPEQFSGPPKYSLEDTAKVEQIYSVFPEGKKILSIHPDSLPHKMWPEKYWLELIERFLKNHSDYCVLIVGLKGIDTSGCECQGRIIPAYGLSIPVSAGLLAKSTIFVGVDSVFLHIADLYRINSLALFGATSSDEWGLRFAGGAHIDEETMGNISVNRVYSAIREFCFDVQSEVGASG